MRLVNPILVTDENGNVRKCYSLVKANRLRRRSAGKGGPQPLAHPTKKPTPGRLRHYDRDRRGISTIDNPPPRWKMLWDYFKARTGKSS